MTDPAARTIVIADDEGEIRSLLAEYLGARGWHTIEAANGLEALLSIKRHHPEAVLLDLQMPRLGGIEALKRIRVFDPAIAVIVISANVDEDVRREAATLGAIAVFDKPFDFRQLLEVLPRQASAPASTAPMRDTPPSPAGSRTSPSESVARTILVVDDDPGVMEVLSEFLVMKGYRVRTASDGASAVRELVAAAPDVVLLDIDLPGLTGVDALPTVRAVAPRTAIIMVSGTTNVEIARRALAGGAFDYVTKPVDLAYLTTSIESALALEDAGLP